jgi:hypothetical protein
MKNTLLLLVLFISFSSPAQKKADIKETEIEVNEKNICKNWIFKDIINPDMTEAERKEHKELMEAFYLNLKEDHTCKMDMIMEEDGTWKLDPAEKTITIKKNDRNQTNVWKVHSLTKNQLIVSRNDATQKIILTAG